MLTFHKGFMLSLKAIGDVVVELWTSKNRKRQYNV